MKKFIIVLAIFIVNTLYSQWINPTGIKIGQATSTTPSPGIKFISSSDTDGFTYNSRFFNSYGFGFYAKTNGNPFNNGTNTYFSSFFGIDFFTNSTHQMRISRDGFIGIGTSNPTAKLEIDSGTPNTSGLKFKTVAKPSSQQNHLII